MRAHTLEERIVLLEWRTKHIKSKVDKSDTDILNEYYTKRNNKCAKGVERQREENRECGTKWLLIFLVIISMIMVPTYIISYFNLSIIENFSPILSALIFVILVISGFGATMSLCIAFNCPP